MDITNISQTKLTNSYESVESLENRPLPLSDQHHNLDGNVAKSPAQHLTKNDTQ